MLINYCCTLVLNAVMACAPPQARAVDADQPRALTGDPFIDIREIGNTQLSIVLPFLPAVTVRDIDRYERWLSLSKEQRAFIDSMYEQYRAKYAEALNEHLARVVPEAKNLETVATQGQIQSPAYAEAYRRLTPLLKEMNQATERLAKTLLFDQLKTVLSEKQLEVFPRVELDHVRRTFPRFDIDHFPATIDLAAIIEDMGFEADTYSALLPDLLEYEKTRTALIVRLMREIEERTIPYAEVVAASPGNRNPPDLALARASMEKRHAMLAPAARLQVDLHELNKRCLSKFSALLEDVHAEALRIAYREKAYPLVYPDRHDVGDIFRRATDEAKRDLISDEVFEALALKYQEYRQRHESACKKMEGWMDRSHADFAATHGKPNGPAFHAAMEELAELRWSLHEQMLQDLKELLPPQVFGDIKNEALILGQRIKFARSRVVPGQVPF